MNRTPRDRPLPEGLELRPLRSEDSIPRLTELLHRAYAQLAARGLRYNATHQSDATTRERCTEGECTVAVLGGRVVGTVTLVHGKPSDCAYYLRPGVARFGQFGVEPSLQGHGIGDVLLAWCEARARELGCTELACDTADQATHLIEMYGRRGFRVVARVRWSSTNYESVVLSKLLA